MIDVYQWCIHKCHQNAETNDMSTFWKTILNRAYAFQQFRRDVFTFFDISIRHEVDIMMSKCIPEWLRYLTKWVSDSDSTFESFLFQRILRNQGPDPLRISPWQNAFRRRQVLVLFPTQTMCHGRATTSHRATVRLPGWKLSVVWPWEARWYELSYQFSLWRRRLHELYEEHSDDDGHGYSEDGGDEKGEDQDGREVFWWDVHGHWWLVRFVHHLDEGRTVEEVPEEVRLRDVLSRWSTCLWGDCKCELIARTTGGVMFIDDIWNFVWCRTHATVNSCSHSWTHHLGNWWRLLIKRWGMESSNSKMITRFDTEIVYCLIAQCSVDRIKNLTKSRTSLLAGSWSISEKFETEVKFWMKYWSMYCIDVMNPFQWYYLCDL